MIQIFICRLMLKQATFAVVYANKTKPNTMSRGSLSASNKLLILGELALAGVKNITKIS